MKRILLAMIMTATPVVYLATGCSFGSPPGTPLPPEASNQNSYLCACDCGPESYQRYNRISTTQDDSKETISTGIVDRGNFDLDMVADRIVGLRFQSLGIPAGSVIQSAKIQFSSRSNDTGPLVVSIQAQKVLDAPLFATSVKDLSSRTLTTQKASWNVPSWATGGVFEAQLSADFSNVLQEIIDQPGWVETNSVAIMIRQTSGTGARHAD